MSGVSRVGRVVALGAVVVLCAAGVALASGWSPRSDLLRSGELPGFVIVKPVRAQQTPAGFARTIDLFPLGERAVRKLLTRLGFVSAAEEELRASGRRRAVSLVAEFSDPRGAQRMAKALYPAAAGVVGRTFSLPGIHTSYGVTIRQKPLALALVYWAQGDCTFGVGEVLPHGSGITARQLASRVIRGAESLNSRTNGTCPAGAPTFTG